MERPALPRHVRVYGNDHSSWTQAVLLGLHERGVPFTLQTVPPLSVFLRTGVFMPVASFDDGPWQLDSARILAGVGFGPVAPATRVALEKAFASAAHRRTDDAWRFWSRFSRSWDGAARPNTRLRNHFLRVFSVIYFFALIRLGRRTQAPPTPAELAAELAFFQKALGDAPFLGGATPDTADLQLFGLVQMMASVPGPSLDVLLHDPTLPSLRAWAERMQGRFRDYPHLQTARDLSPQGTPPRSSGRLDRVCFWAGATTMAVALPAVLPAVATLAARVRRQGLAR